jgi:hypothetical protein
VILIPPPRTSLILLVDARLSRSCLTGLSGVTKGVVAVAFEMGGSIMTGAVFPCSSLVRRSCPSIYPAAVRTVRLLQRAIHVILAHGADQHNADVPRTNMIFLGGRILCVIRSQIGHARQRRNRRGCESGRTRWGINKLGGVRNKVNLVRKISISRNVEESDACVDVL